MVCFSSIMHSDTRTRLGIATFAPLARRHRIVDRPIGIDEPQVGADRRQSGRADLPAVPHVFGGDRDRAAVARLAGHVDGGDVPAEAGRDACDVFGGGQLAADAGQSHVGEVALRSHDVEYHAPHGGHHVQDRDALALGKLHRMGGLEAAEEQESGDAGQRRQNEHHPACERRVHGDHDRVVPIDARKHHLT